MLTATDNSFWFNTFEEHGPSILAFLHSRVGRRDDEDLLQETFVRAMRKEPDLPDGKIKTYLFTTAYHLVIDQRRRKRPTLFSEMPGDESWPERQLQDEGTISQERSADLQRLGEHLEAALGRLKPAHRTAFEQAVMHQKSYGEIAEEQAWTLEQVKINVYRGRKQVMGQLRDLLSPTPEYGS